MRNADASDAPESFDPASQADFFGVVGMSKKCHEQALMIGWG